MSGRAIKAKCWIITTIKAAADIRGQVKYDLADCKITEGEKNALSVLTDKRQTQRRRSGGVMSEEGGQAGFVVSQFTAGGDSSRQTGFCGALHQPPRCLSVSHPVQHSRFYLHNFKVFVFH